MNWNTFDFLLVVFALVDDVVMAIVGHSDGETNLTFMRTLRVLKVAKVLRALRVMRYFSELRLILNSIVGSFLSLCWSMLTLSLIFYIFALCLVQGVSRYLADEKSRGKEYGGEIIQFFGTVGDTMLTLYKTCTGGDDWGVFFDQLKLCGLQYACLFIFFVAFIQIALFNIVTAIFVESAMQLAQPDREAMALQLRKNELAERSELLRLCKGMDINSDGCLDQSEFSRHLTEGKLKQYLAVAGLDVKEADVFLKMISKAAHDAPIHIDDFVDGCLRMKGTATSLDMQALLFETKAIYMQFETFQSKCDKLFRSLNVKTGEARL
jgi:hypothetical protein